MKLLLHACCAPCAIHPIRQAIKDGFSVTGFFYNPNIHPHSEYLKRQKETEEYFKSEEIQITSFDYEPYDYFKSVNTIDTSPKRCESCWDMRMLKTTSLAKEKKFDSFTTTLLGSPYQDHSLLKNICQKFAEKNKIEFYYKDFREGFRDAHKFARNNGIYCQKYCGCIFSMVEREEAVKRKDNSK